jgi:hypothetical protein
VTASRASADSEIASSLSTAGAVLIARQIDEARIEPAEGFVPAEQLELVPLLEREHARADRAQLVERRM